MLAFLLFTILLLAFTGLLHKFWNKKRDKQEAIDAQSMWLFFLLLSLKLMIIFPDGVVHEKVENEEFADLTDFQLRSFRYPI
jgi:hypothetical protein